MPHRMSSGKKLCRVTALNKTRYPGFLEAAWIILRKDFREYYGKAPTFSWGVLFPLALVVLLGYYSRAYGPWKTIPGLITISLIFSSSTMPQVSVGFDKLSGGMNLFLSSPLRFSSLYLGKSLGGIIFGLLGSGVAAGTLLALRVQIPYTHPIFLVVGIVLGGLIFSSIAMALAFLYPATQAVAVLNIIRFTMVFLGGILFPKIVMPHILIPLVYALPAVYVNEMVRWGTFNTFDYIDPYTSITILVIYTIFTVFVSYMIVKKAVNR